MRASNKIMHGSDFTRANMSILIAVHSRQFHVQSNSNLKSTDFVLPRLKDPPTERNIVHVKMVDTQSV